MRLRATRLLFLFARQYFYTTVNSTFFVLAPTNHCCFLSQGMVRHRDEMLEGAQAEMQEIRKELQAQGSHTALLAREWDGHLNKSKVLPFIKPP
jgi:sRNA-binding protein